MQQDISKLEPGEIELTRARQAQDAVEAARKRHESARTERAAAFQAANKAGKTQQQIAKATGVSQPRVGQIIGSAS